MSKQRTSGVIQILEGYQPKSLTTDGPKTSLADDAKLNLQKLKPPKLEWPSSRPRILLKKRNDP